MLMSKSFLTRGAKRIEMTQGILLCLLCAVIAPASCICGEPLRLTTDGSFKQHLQWSPDGKTLLFTRIYQGKMALWVMPVAGG